MRRFLDTLWHAILLCLITIAANGYFLAASDPRWLLLMIPGFILANAAAGFGDPTLPRGRLRILRHGAVSLVLFLISAVLSAAYHIVLFITRFADSYPESFLPFLLGALICVAAEAILFWNGIISVYTTSTQLGIKLRVIGIICGMIPVANLIALFAILRTVFRELSFERIREARNKARESDRVCETKYPLLLIHGVFFRDSRFLDYWGRIPAELKRNGAAVHYGNHGSAASVADSAEEIAERIREIVAETGCGKVNVIAHSKGGLDCRYAIANSGVADLVASLTTVNTPHRGCVFADHLLSKIPEKVQTDVAKTYNTTLRKLGDKNPDFLAAVNDLTASACERFDGIPMPDGVFCRSIGSIMPKAAGGQFPLNLSYTFVKHFDGVNDGLVSEDSFKWGENYTLLRPTGDRGISHGDVIDLNREDIEGFDVREFYVNLVNELKEMQL